MSQGQKARTNGSNRPSVRSQRRKKSRKRAGQIFLNLGSGPHPVKGYINVDIEDNEGTDQKVDLNLIPWPWEDSSVDEILAKDVLEHLCPLGRGQGQMNIKYVMEEIYRILKPGGILQAKVPTTDGRGAWQDFTHVTYWNANSFLYFDPSTPQYTFRNTHAQFQVQRLEHSVAPGDVVWMHVIAKAIK